ncbi:MAG: acyl-CoA thioesterase [Anaerolineae bacterium]|nr:acyl-CoA thioesterase [Anaerolineae bacterium]
MTAKPPEGVFVAESEIEVRYAETDAMGVVHHGSFVIYLELGRTGYMRQRGHDYSSFERTGHHMAVVELNVRYHLPARYGQRLRIRSWIKDMNRRSITFGYIISDVVDNTCLVTGSSRHVCITEAGQVATIPEPWICWRGS